MSVFTTQMIPVQNERILFVFKSPEVNISFISSIQYCSLSFDLEVITKNKAMDEINKLKNYIDFNWEELVDNVLDFNVVCRFDGKTDEDILRRLNECFGLDLTFERST